MRLVLGHLKIIDFGTAKDLVEVDLNGPEFVGTPEYMSPSTVRSKPKELQTGPAVDLYIHTYTYLHTHICIRIHTDSYSLRINVRIHTPV